MKKRITIAFIFFTKTFFLYSQSIHPDVDYYPMHVGNYWEYIEQWNGSPNISVFVEKDTLLSNGHLYKKIVTKFLSSGNIRNITYERVDSLTAQVYRYSEYCGQEIVIDSLAASPDDIFQAIRFDSAPPCSGSTISGTYYPDSLIFGNNTQVKGFVGVYALDSPSYSMAKGFGIVSMTGYIFFRKLEYAIINGISYGTPVSVIYENELPMKFNLYQNYPNPFNYNTHILFSIPNRSYVELLIFDIRGSKIKTLVNEVYEPGIYDVSFSGEELSSGLYIYQLRTYYFISTKKMILLK